MRTLITNIKDVGQNVLLDLATISDLSNDLEVFQTLKQQVDVEGANGQEVYLEMSTMVR